MGYQFGRNLSDFQNTLQNEMHSHTNIDMPIALEKPRTMYLTFEALFLPVAVTCREEERAGCFTLIAFLSCD